MVQPSYEICHPEFPKAQNQPNSAKKSFHHAHITDGKVHSREACMNSPIFLYLKALPKKPLSSRSMFSKKKVFIGSSTEVKNKNFLIPVIEILQQNDYEVTPWFEAFPGGNFVLDQLMAIVQEMDCAIFFFGKDARQRARGKNKFVTSGNVLIEYGMFLSKLGKERVRIIHEANTDIPTDLEGLSVNRITNIAQIERQTNVIVSQWKRHLSYNDNFGVNRTIGNYRNTLKSALEASTSINEKERTPNYPAFNMDWLVSFYTSALQKTAVRFWTTTYLSSAFWVYKNANVINSNLELLQRFNPTGGKPTGEIRRLFLLKRNFEEEKNILIRRINGYSHRESAAQDFEDLMTEYENLQSNCRKLMDSHCKIKFFYDTVYYQEIERIDSDFKRHDTEIALYDNFRLDRYGGGNNKKITGVRILTKSNEDFDSLSTAYEQYFDQMWKKAIDIKTLFNEYDRIFNYHRRKLDYSWKNLFTLYKRVNPHDNKVMDSEFTITNEYLESGGYYSMAKSYLDIGTFAGRYPFTLVNKLQDDCEIFGVDADPDCIDFCETEKKGHRKENFISFFHADFLFADPLFPPQHKTKKFDIITCMLGTVSHFGWNKQPDWTDDLQFALSRMKGLLSDKGVLIISNWSIHLGRNHFLSIYTPKDRKTLTSFTETTEILLKRLQHLNFSTETKFTSDGNLEVIFCSNK